VNKRKLNKNVSWGARQTIVIGWRRWGGRSGDGAMVTHALTKTLGTHHKEEYARMLRRSGKEVTNTTRVQNQAEGGGGAQVTRWNVSLTSVCRWGNLPAMDVKAVTHKEWSESKTSAKGGRRR